MLQKTLTAVSVALILGGCGMTPMELPKNVKTNKQGYGDVLSTVSYEHTSPMQDDFSKAVFCVTEVVTNEEVVLTDTADSWVGSFSGNLYKNTDTQVVGGGNVLQYVDEKNQRLSARGSDEYSYVFGLAPIENVVQFSISVTLDNGELKTKFSNIKRAQKSTGLSDNNGFTAVYTHSGAKPNLVVQMLESVHEGLISCYEG
ncbi:hypothetical protein [Planctobacterium marinum]|uniref:Lipoprotein n=1 Tax=Planctobacterium marinum TaxID=1631968 RepID=A0AA48HUY4_9ALTE|nr:hypothetical protein MACH26_39650 [Planctobacterium marinum]